MLPIFRTSESKIQIQLLHTYLFTVKYETTETEESDRDCVLCCITVLVHLFGQWIEVSVKLKGCDAAENSFHMSLFVFIINLLTHKHTLLTEGCLLICLTTVKRGCIDSDWWIGEHKLLRFTMLRHLLKRV